jgi:hypothetical protein
VRAPERLEIMHMGAADLAAAWADGWRPEPALRVETFPLRPSRADVHSNGTFGYHGCTNTPDRAAVDVIAGLLFARQAVPGARSHSCGREHSWCPTVPIQ